MMRRFVVAVDNAPFWLRDAFTKHIESLQTVAWWHLIANVWLITDNDGRADAAGWRDLALQFMPGAIVFVQEVGTTRGEWAAWAHQMGHKWLHDFWG
jgi:hypothetical protein